MALPTISRARDLLVSVVSSCPIEQYGTQWSGEDMEEIPLPPETWMFRPDPRTTRVHWLSWITDDLIFYGRAFALVTSRSATGFPASFQWLPSEYVNVQASMFAGNAPVTAIEAIRFQGADLPIRDVVCFWAPHQPVLGCGTRAICTAQRLDLAAERFASSPIAFGWLSQTGGEPLSTSELGELAEGWAAARELNSVAALNEFVQWNESGLNPSVMQLVEGRQHQAVELARLMSVPSYLVNADSGSSMTYQNALQAKEDLYDLGALPLIECIEQTLSRDDVTPRGRLVRLNSEQWKVPAAEMVPDRNGVSV
jgi:phage portal protein BeeE